MVQDAHAVFAGGARLFHNHAGSLLPHLTQMLPLQVLDSLCSTGDSASSLHSDDWIALSTAFLCMDVQKVKSEIRVYTTEVPYGALDTWTLEPQPLVCVELSMGNESAGAKAYHATWHSLEDSTETVHLHFFGTAAESQVDSNVQAPMSVTLRSVAFRGMAVVEGLPVQERTLNLTELNALRIHFGFPELRHREAWESGPQETAAEPKSGVRTVPVAREFNMVIEEDRHANVCFRLTGSKVEGVPATELKVRKCDGAAGVNSTGAHFEIVDAGVLATVTYGSLPLWLDKATFEVEEASESESKPASILIRIPKRKLQGITRRFTESSFLFQVQQCYSKQGLVTLSGAQFGTEERYISRTRDPAQLPPLIALKDSFMFFYQCCHQKHFSVLQRDQGVVAVMVHHGLVLNRHSGIPWVDLSVCFLTHEMLMDVAPLASTFETQHIKMEQNEYELFQRVFQVCRLQSFAPDTEDQLSTLLDGGCNTGTALGVTGGGGVSSGRIRKSTQNERTSHQDLFGVCTEHPELKTLFQSESARRHFRRAFLGPLYLPVFQLADLSKIMHVSPATELAMAGKTGTLFGALRTFKEQGNTHFRAKDLEKAASLYKCAVSQLTSGKFDKADADSRSASEKRAIHMEAAAVFSNLAQCLLRQGELQEVIFATGSALEHLEATQTVSRRDGSKPEHFPPSTSPELPASSYDAEDARVLASKVWQRRGKAYEGLSRGRDAKRAMDKAILKGV